MSEEESKTRLNELVRSHLDSVNDRLREDRVLFIHEINPTPPRFIAEMAASRAQTGVRRVNVIREFCNSVLEKEAEACGMLFPDRPSHAMQVATSPMNKNAMKFSMWSRKDDWHLTYPRWYESPRERVDRRHVERFELTHDQIFFMNWLLQWHRMVWKLEENNAELMEKDLEALVETCKEDHEIVVPYPQDPIKSALKEGNHSST